MLICSMQEQCNRSAAEQKPSNENKECQHIESGRVASVDVMRLQRKFSIYKLGAFAFNAARAVVGAGRKWLM